jgi:site-specific recombinase XerD
MNLIHLSRALTGKRFAHAKRRPPKAWVFASPAQLGHLPWSYDQIWRVYQKAAKVAGIGSLGTYTLRHTYCSCLDAVGTGLTVQQKLIRHADIRTPMNVYGDTS